jgi:hypothetical protein
MEQAVELCKCARFRERIDSFGSLMVSVVVSIQMRKMFGEVRKSR